MTSALNRASSKQLPRITFIINDLDRAGAQRVFVDDANTLHAQGFSVHVVTLYRGGALENELIVPLTILHATSPYDLRAQKAFHKLLASRRGSILISTLNESNLFARFAALCASGVTLYTREANMADHKSVIYKVFDVLLGWRSKRIIAVSHAVRASLVRYLPWYAQSITVLYNGVHQPVGIVAKERLEYRLISVGSLTKKKDHKVLIRALTFLPATFELTLIGEGPLRSELEILTHELNIKDRIHFLGECSASEIVQTYSTHGIFVLPSRYEGCPNVVLEAKIHGLPIVAFDIPGIDEFVSDRSGFVVEKRTPEALANGILSVGKELTEKQQGAISESEMYSYEHHFEKLLRLLGLPR